MFLGGSIFLLRNMHITSFKVRSEDKIFLIYGQHSKLLVMFAKENKIKCKY